MADKLALRCRLAIVTDGIRGCFFCANEARALRPRATRCSMSAARWRLNA